MFTTVCVCSELYIHLVDVNISFPVYSALVEFVRPMKVDQLCVMVKLMKESTSTSIILEATLNHS